MRIMLFRSSPFREVERWTIREELCDWEFTGLVWCIFALLSRF